MMIAKREQQQRNPLREHVRAVGQRKFPDAARIEPHEYDRRWYVEVWDDDEGVAFTHFLQDEELL
jgi:hypothetical protein